jgi:membrane protease YdiL (CAAX protease family)
MNSQTMPAIEPRATPRLRLLLRILRNPFVSLLVLYNLVFYVHWSGNAYIITFGTNSLGPLLLASGPFLPYGAGIFIIGNLLLVYGSYTRAVEHRSATEISLPGMGPELGIGLLLGFALMSACFLIGMALGVNRIEGIDRWQNLVAGVTAGTVTTPFSEELLFRGVVFRLLEEVFGGWVALVLSSLWFGYVHSGNEGETLAGLAAIAIVYGPMLAAPFMLTRRLWMGTGLHLAWNYTMGKVYSGSVSGGDHMQGLFKTSFQGPDLLTGGSAGMEGSLIGVLVAITFTVAMLVLAGRRGAIVPPYWSRPSLRAHPDP